MTQAMHVSEFQAFVGVLATALARSRWGDCTSGHGSAGTEGDLERRDPQQPRVMGRDHQQ